MVQVRLDRQHEAAGQLGLTLRLISSQSLLVSNGRNVALPCWVSSEFPQLSMAPPAAALLS